MKTIQMITDFDYRPHPRKLIRFHAGVTYSRVLETAVRQIEAAGAGRMVSPPASGTYLTRDASHAFKPRGRR